MAASAGPTPKEAPPEDSPLQAEADDLTRMAGIGPTYAMRLRDGGITPTVVNVITADEEVSDNADKALGIELTPLRDTLAKILETHPK